MRFVLALCLAAVAVAARADRVDSLVRAAMASGHVPGLSLAITRRGKVVKTAGYGYANLELRVRATPNTVYSLHSVSKQFTAAAAMILVERGMLNLDESVTRYLSGLPDAWKPITIRNLLTHTCGIPDYLNEMNLSGNSDSEVIAALGKLPLRFAPGDKWSYSNSGYLVLAQVVLKVSGRTTQDLLQERVFGPLHMDATRSADRSVVIPNRSSKYIWKDGAFQNAEFAITVEQVADGGLMSTALDLAKWDAALYTDRVLRPESLKQMWTAHRLNNGASTGYGFGWFVVDTDGRRRLVHYGASANGDRAAIARYPDDGLGIIILVNGGTPDFKTLITGIAAHYAPDLKDPAPDE
ncbi:MAG TPA: serine hydrolase domain-containing protein [Armatimonadota bacterium]|jgi:CubicO group peptidase (beta-lactamase class C family)